MQKDKLNYFETENNIISSNIIEPKKDAIINNANETRQIITSENNIDKKEEENNDLMNEIVEKEYLDNSNDNMIRKEKLMGNKEEIKQLNLEIENNDINVKAFGSNNSTQMKYINISDKSSKLLIPNYLNKLIKKSSIKNEVSSNQQEINKEDSTKNTKIKQYKRATSLPRSIQKKSNNSKSDSPEKSSEVLTLKKYDSMPKFNVVKLPSEKQKESILKR